MNKECINCGSNYSVKPSHYDKRSYCSIQCMSSDYKKRMSGENNPNYKGTGKRKCVCCSREYESYSKTRKYCSQDCYHKSKPKKQIVSQFKFTLKIPCPYCGFGSLGKDSATCGNSVCQKKHKDKRHNELEKICCYHCDISFHAPLSADRKYCSYECFINSGGAKRAGQAAVKMMKKYGNKKDANHVEIVSAFKKMGAGVIDLSDVGNGVPDLIVSCRKTLYLVDIKNPNTSYGKRGLNPLQTEWAKDWKGGNVYLIYTVDDVILMVNGELSDLKSVG